MPEQKMFQPKIDTRLPENTVIRYYDSHPINESQIMDAIKGLDLGDEPLRPHHLFAFDQDHFGGLEATRTLAQLTQMNAESVVLDVCSGVGGPSRFFADQYGCCVTGIDFTETRRKTAIKLTEMVGLSDKVTFIQSDATDMPFDDNEFDIIVAQEAWCHIGDKNQLISECSRVMRTGGTLAFTDIVKHDAATDHTLERLGHEMTFQGLASINDYVSILKHHGFNIKEVSDLTDEWTRILVQRLEMYRGLEQKTREVHGEARAIEWDRAYSFFVNRYQTRELGGVRLVANKLS